MSQYDIRAASVLKPNDVQTEHYYTVGTNDVIASQTLKLTPHEYDFRDRDTENYLAWIKNVTRRGFAPTITVFMNHWFFYHDSDPAAGYFDYDHIVSVRAS